MNSYLTQAANAEKRVGEYVRRLRQEGLVAFEIQDEIVLKPDAEERAVEIWREVSGA